MPARVSEAIVLRTYPFQEADLVVSFLTRDLGKLRGVAKRARRPKSDFGASLERLSQVQMSYVQRPTRELVSVDSCELIQSQFSLVSDYATGVALDYIAEVTEQLLPAGEPNERYFRLLLVALSSLRDRDAGALWRVVTYFSLWAVRLSGLLPELHVCLGCGTWLDDPEAPQQAFFQRFEEGLRCSHCRRPSSRELSFPSRAIANEMLHKPIAALSHNDWSKDTAADLRHFLVQRIENHIERKLVTAPMLEGL